MHLSRIKTLLAAPESSVEYYLTASVSSIAANASGAADAPTQNIVVSRYKKVGTEAAVLTTDGTLRLYAVNASAKTPLSQQPSASDQTFTFVPGNGQGYTSIQVELTDANGTLMCAPLSIPIIWKGADGVSYEIMTSVSTIRADKDGNVQTGPIIVLAYKTTGATRTLLTLRTGGTTPHYKMQYQIDWGQWVDCANIEVSGLNLGPGVPGSATSTITWGVGLRLLYGTPGNYTEVYQMAPLQVVRDGQTGERGKTGRFYYYDGYFDSTKEYTATDYIAPYVAFEWTDTRTIDGVQTNVLVTDYYMLVAATNKSGNTYIAPRTETESPVWERMVTSFRYMITEAFFSNFAKLGSAVFSGDWMISQHGTLNGAASTAYQNFDASDPTGTVAGHFVPNYAIDLLTGRAYLNNAVIKGEVFAEGGTFSGYLKTPFKHLSACDATVTESGGYTYYRLNKDLNVKGWNGVGINNVILLPNDTAYVGAEVNIYAGVQLSRAGLPVEVGVEGGYKIHGYPYLSNPSIVNLDFPTRIHWEGGVMSLVCVNEVYENGANVTWVVKSFTFRTQSYS